jgi:outer membrane protein OmpA-like peptidoglycan-associated protein
MKKCFTTLICLLVVSACTIDPYTGQQRMSNTAKGAMIGTAAGAIAGGLANGGKGALVGGLVGAASGTAVGGYMDVQAKAVRQELQGTGVQVFFENDQINLIMPGNITFDTNSSDVKESFKATLNSIAKVVNKYNKTILNVTGYTDSTGTDAKNNYLSLSRANSVANYLKTRGVDGGRINTSGKGSKNPIASNSTAAGREQNRRVEINLVQIVN